MNRSVQIAIILLVALVVAGTASAQPWRDPQDGGSWDDLEAVEQGVADVDPLSASLRDLQSDLRQPSGFDRVYRVPGREDLLMRADGGLYAVFPRSWYERRRRGTAVLVPPQTMFFIGRPSPELLGPAPAGTTNDEADRITSAFGAGQRLSEQMIARPEQAVGRLELRMKPLIETRNVDGDASVEASDSEASSPERPSRPRATTSTTTTRHVEPRIIRDERYRTRRLRELMRRAAGREG